MTIDANPASDSPRRGSKQGQQTLAAILTAACKIASEEGLEQLSMRRLAAAVGISKSGLYAHFTSKEELQLATIAHVREVFEANVAATLGSGSDSGLAALLDRWLSFFERKKFPGGCFLIVSAVEFATRQGPVAAALTEALDREIAVLETAVEAANQTGELHPQRDPGQTAFELHSILMNTHALSQVKRDPAVFDRARTAIHTLLGELDHPPTSKRGTRP